MTHTSQELFQVSNLFYLGNFQGAITEGEGLSPELESVRTERDVFVYRSYIALGRAPLVVQEVSPSTPSTALQAVRLFAIFSAAATRAEEDVAVEQVRALLANAAVASNPTLQVLGAAMLEAHGAYEDALRAAHACRSLEGKAVMAQLYLRIDRPEQADKELKAMRKSDDDATLTQLTAVRLHLHSGAEARAREALSIVEDLIERFGATALLHNAAASCNMHLRRWEDAETSLKEAVQKDPNNAGALVNLALVSGRLGKHPLAARYVAQLKSLPKPHPWVADLQHAEASFDQAAAAVAK